MGAERLAGSKTTIPGFVSDEMISTTYKNY